MATRAIVTSHPVVACDVCGRRLLRGESPDVFLAGGQRRTVCELCVPRAMIEGWLREAESHEASALPARPRRTGSLLGKLRQLREPSQRLRRLASSPDELAAERAGHARPEDGIYDFLEGGSIERAESYEQDAYLLGSTDEPSYAIEDGADRARGDSEWAVLVPVDESVNSTRERPVRAAPSSGELKVERALQVFNSGELPRRIAGVARSLGAPAVAVRPLESSGNTVGIVVAWDLCWYRYAVDLGDEAAGAKLVDQGMELDELPEGDRLANAVADERGELAVLQA